jgi:hypothetical protein
MSTFSSKQSALDVDRMLEDYDKKYGPKSPMASPKRFQVNEKIKLNIKNSVKIDKSGHIKFKNPARKCCKIKHQDQINE